YAGVAGFLPPDSYAGPALDTIHKALSPDYGDIPDNGAFLSILDKISGALKMVGIRRKLSQITDGQNKSFMLGECVHSDLKLGGVYLEPFVENLNVRPWYIGSYSDAFYHAKVAEYPPNACLARSDGIPFNHLPMGSYHPGLTLFAHVDASVVSISNEIDTQV